MSFLDDINPVKLAKVIITGNKSGRSSKADEEIPPIGACDIDNAMGYIFGTYDTSPYASKENFQAHLKKQGKR